MNLTRLAIQRPTLISVVFIILLVSGSISYFFLSYELVPRFNPPTIAVTTAYGGASPTEVEARITRPIEDVLSALSGVNRMHSVSQENFSLVRLELNAGIDIDQLLQQAQRRLLLIRDDLPGEVQPVISRFDFDDLPVLRLGAYSALPETDFYHFIREVVQPRISRVEGVAEVKIIGGKEREIRVEIDPRKLNLTGLSLMGISQAISQNNIDVPAGRVSDGDGQFPVKLKGTFETIDDLEDIVVAVSPDGSKVFLRDVAVVRDTFKEPKVISRLSGKESLAIEVRKQTDANAVNMSKEVKIVLDELEDRHQGISLDFVIAADSSDFTLKAANAVMADLGYAVLLVSLVMLLFLHSIRNGLIVLIAIPTSIISTLLVMFVLGYTLNLMTLLALSLAIGILVDDSIVVLENIYRHLEMGKSRTDAAFDGRMEIGFTAISITLVDVVVFMPILFSQGIVADLFEQFSVVMIASTLISLFVSFTLVPLFASRFSRVEEIDGHTFIGKLVVAFERLIDRVLRGLVSVLNWALRNKAFTLAFALGLFLGSLGLVFYGFIGIEFTKAGDRGEFIIELELPTDATLERTNQVTLLVEQYLHQLPEVETVFTTVGMTSSGRIASNPSHIAELLVKLVDKRRREMSAGELARQIKIDLLSNIPDLKISPVEINLIGLRDDGAVQLTLFGSDVNELLPLAQTIEHFLDSIPGTVEVKSSIGSGGMELGLEVDRQRSAVLGLNLAMVGATLRTALNGREVGKFKQNDRDYDITLRLEDFFRRSVDQVGNLSVIDDRGKQISLNQFTTVSELSTPGHLERTNRLSSVTITSQALGRTGAAIGNELEAKLRQMKMPVGVDYVFTGQLERLSDGLQILAVALIASILFVYLIMVALYDSFVYPFVVLFSIPMAVVGALLMLALMQQTLNIFSIFGLIMLVGLVGKNAILVVDFTNKLRNEGYELYQSLIEATKLRFRPVLMTNLSMVIGLMPIALASGAGSEWKNGLAWALIGGLSSSMFLSLILVPVVYILMDGLFLRRKSPVVHNQV